MITVGLPAPSWQRGGFSPSSCTRPLAPRCMSLLQPATRCSHHPAQPATRCTHPHPQPATRCSPRQQPPISAPKTHNLQPAAPINPNRAIQSPSRPPQELGTLHSALRSPALPSLIKTLSDTEKSAMLAHLQPLLSTLSKLTALGTVPAPEATP